MQEPESPPLPVTVFEPYMIKRGDFLTKIALREYGDASMWRDIYSWNKDEIGDNPDRLYPYNFLSLKRESTDVRDCEPEFFDYTIQSLFSLKIFNRFNLSSELSLNEVPESIISFSFINLFTPTKIVFFESMPS